MKEIKPIHFKLDRKTNIDLERTADVLMCTRSELLRRSFRIFQQLFMANSEGSEVILRDKKRKNEKVILIG